MEHIKKLLQRVCKKRERKARKEAEKNCQGDTWRKNEARKMEPSNISEILLSAQTKLQTNTESDPKGRIVIVIGESGSGKTFQIVRPNMLGFHSLIMFRAQTPSRHRRPGSACGESTANGVS